MRHRGRVDWATLRGVVWDWGDTLMRDIPGQPGPMVTWPRVEAMPGAGRAVKALSRLAVQCVATNAEDSDGQAVAEALDRVGLRDRLTHFITSGEVGVAKPSPRFFRAAARHVSLPPESILSVGNDYAKDVVPAKAAGMSTVYVAGEEPSGELGAADLVVPDLASLAQLVEEHYAMSSVS